MADPDFFLFVSHVSEDRAAALEIVSELERRGVPCWIAPRDVEPGKPFDDEIADALDDCRAVLLIFSERCNDSDYIRREITVAGESHKVIIPFRIEDAAPRRGLRVRLSDLHWLDGFVSRERAIDELATRFVPSAARKDKRERQEPEQERQAEVERPISQAPPPPPPPPAQRVAETPQLVAGNANELGTEIGLHIMGLGDRRYSAPGWTGNPGGRRQIEAISIRPLGSMPPSAVELRVFTQDGQATAWVSHGHYAGTRGRGLPITGFAVRLATDHREGMDIVYEGSFFEGGAVGPKRNGELCTSPIENDPLEAIRVSMFPHKVE